VITSYLMGVVMGTLLSVLSFLVLATALWLEGRVQRVRIDEVDHDSTAH
jgi:hypothetical protein